MPDFTFNPQNLIDTAGGGILGIALGGLNDRRQVRQAERLQALQIAGQKEMTDYQMMKQLQMWKDTNYSAQVAELDKAGLNSALLYGMKGGGGATTGSPGGSVTGQQAPAGGREIQEMMQMNIQMRLLKAQEENIKADTELKKTDAAFKSGVQTEQTKEQTELLAQELINKREDFQIKRLQQTMMNIENFEKQATQEDRLDYIEYQTKIAMKQLALIANQLQITDATIQDQITRIHAEAIGAGLQNELTRAQTGKTKSDIEVNQKQISMWIQSNMREWDKMSQTNKEIAVKQLLSEYTTDPVNDATKNISNLIDNIFFLAPKTQQGRTVVEGFKKY